MTLGPICREFRALKVWFTLETVGTERIGAAMERCCGVAKQLEHHLRRLTCFSVQAGATSSRSDRTGLQEGGLAAASLTTRGGRKVICAATSTTAPRSGTPISFGGTSHGQHPGRLHAGAPSTALASPPLAQLAQMR